MPLQEFQVPITFVEYNGIANRPSTGDAGKVYVDISTGGANWSWADMYVWVNSSWTTLVGPHPIKPGH